MMSNMALTTNIPAPGPAPAGPTATALQKYVKGTAGGERTMTLMSDDNMMMKQILETHAPDGLEFDVKPLLILVEDILSRATHSADTLVTVRSTKLISGPFHHLRFEDIYDRFFPCYVLVCRELRPRTSNPWRRKLTKPVSLPCWKLSLSPSTASLARS